MGSRSLKTEFPRLFSLSTEKDETLHQISLKKSLLGEWQLQFRRSLLAWEVKEQQRLCGLLVASPILRVGFEDTCSWAAEGSGQFTVSSVRKWRDSVSGQGVAVPPGVWVNLAPPKMQFFCWLSWRGKVKTLTFLQRIGVLDVSVNNLCVFYHLVEESAEHVLLHCPVVWKCWSHMVY